MSFGLLSYRTNNLGDQIQSIAAQRFLPRVDRLLDRDALDRPLPPEPVHAILNGWFVHEPGAWPPDPAIRPLAISMHLDNRRARRRFWRPSAARRMLQGAGREWFVQHGPVGARDQATLELLHRAGIDAWYSGCLTLTLPASPEPREDLIIACDLAPAAVAALREQVRTPLTEVTHHDTATEGHEARMAAAGSLLALYGRAKAVVTSRLHGALPCLALGTPVLFVPNVPDPPRQAPGLELCRTASLDSLSAGRTGFDFENPTPNPQDWQSLARELSARCEAFVAAAERVAAA